MATPETSRPDFAAVVELARFAPSVHNTQPWIFHDSGDLLTLSRDSERRLPALDPAARQQTVSCGAALHLARLGLRLQGFDSLVEFPEAVGDERVVARVRAVKGPGVTAEEVVLERAARARHSQRGPFEDRPVAEDAVNAMRIAAQQQGAWVRLLKESTDQVALAVLLARADEVEASDPSYRDELAQWTHRPAGTHDGVPSYARPDVRDRASTLRQRDFGLEDEVTTTDDNDAPPPTPEHFLAVVLGTAGDSVTDWLVAGQALSALLLRAVVDGVQASVLGQVLDQPWTRRRLATEIGSVGQPQMVLRVGYATPGPATPRRPVDDVLR